MNGERESRESILSARPDDDGYVCTQPHCHEFVLVLLQDLKNSKAYEIKMHFLLTE